MNELSIATEQTMSSLEISELVESRHDKVKQSIERLVEKGVISHPPLGDGPKSSNGVVVKIYQLSKRDSYVVVAQLCPQFTARLVDRWQELESKQATPMTQLEMIAHTALALNDANKRIDDQERRLLEVEARQSAIVEGFKYYTVLGYANIYGLQHLILKDAQSIGKKCATISRDRKIPIDKVRDQRFGIINAYQESILNEVVSEYMQ